MKRLLAMVLITLISLTMTFTRPALAGDVGNGVKIFGANCASCHLNGKNLVNAAKTLSKADLDKYGMNSLDAIITQVTNGKAAMPSFKAKLDSAQIEDVAAYVLAQAEKGW